MGGFRDLGFERYIGSQNVEGLGLQGLGTHICAVCCVVSDTVGDSTCRTRWALLTRVACGV